MRKLLIPTLAATLAAAAACGGDSSTGPAVESISGSYALKTVNSSSLPYTMPDDGTGTFEILANSYSIGNDNKYTSTIQVRATFPGSSPSVLSVDSHGTYSKSGASIILTDADDPTDKKTATISGATMTISVDGFVLVYQRSGS